jgi:hypothetical protein
MGCLFSFPYAILQGKGEVGYALSDLMICHVKNCAGKKFLNACRLVALHSYREGMVCKHDGDRKHALKR